MKTIKKIKTTKKKPTLEKKKKTTLKPTIKKQSLKKPAPKKVVKPITKKQTPKVVAQRKKVVTVKKVIQGKRSMPKSDSLIAVTVKKHRDKNGNHNHVILDTFDDKHVSVGLSTKRKKGKKGGNNYPLKKDTLDIGQKGYRPKKDTHMRRQGTVDKKNNYFREMKGSMDNEDYKKAVEYGKRAKEKYLKNKKSNGSAKLVNKSPLAMGRKNARPLLKSSYQKQSTLSRVSAGNKATKTNKQVLSKKNNKKKSG